MVQSYEKNMRIAKFIRAFPKISNMFIEKYGNYAIFTTKDMVQCFGAIFFSTGIYIDTMHLFPIIVLSIHRCATTA